MGGPQVVVALRVLCAQEVPGFQCKQGLFQVFRISPMLGEVTIGDVAKDVITQVVEEISGTGQMTRQGERVTVDVDQVCLN